MTRPAAADTTIETVCSVRDACLASHRACGVAAWRASSAFRKLQLARGERADIDANGPIRLHTLRSGLVAHCGMLPDGRRQIYCLTAPGESLCAGLLAGMDTWVEALTQTEICELTVGAVAEPDDRLFQAVVASGAERLAAAFRHIVMLGQLNAVERVRTFLADMARRTGRRDPDGWHLNLPLSREDIGDYLGLNAESVSRALRDVKGSGAAHFVTPTQLRVADLGQLACASLPCTQLTEPARAS